MSSHEVSNKTPSPRHSCQLENMKKITEKEGRLARNLLSWSIPVDDKDRMKNKRSRYNKYPKNGDACNQKNTSKKYCYGRSRYETKENEKIDNENNSESNHGSKKISFRARYWGYLFDNLKRAVDEIYATCQSDSSVVECKEVLLMLDNYRHDFKALMNWIQLEEKLENTDLNDRPTSLSWEVRKSSLGPPKRNQNKKKVKSTNNKKKILPKQNEKPKFSTSNNISLQSGDKNNESPVQNQLLATSNICKSNSMSSVATWADKVKGITNKSSVVTNNYQKTSSAPSEVSVSSLNNVQLENVNEKQTDSDAETGDGWEKVSRLNKQSRNNKRSSFESEVVVTSNKVTKSFKSRMSPQTKSPVNNFKNKETKSGSYTLKRVQEPGKRIRANTTPLPNFKIDKAETIIKAKEAKSDTVVVTSKTDEVSATQTEENNQLTLDSSLIKLEEWEADLARTLTDQHDANILVAEQRERDLMRQLREVEEETSAESDTCENAKSMTGTNDLSEEKHCDHSEEDNYNYYYQEFVKKAEKEAAEGTSWFEQVEAYNKLKQVREPGSIIQMHEKLSSPSRKRTPAESKRKLEEKHRKAEVRRQEIEKARSQRIRELTEKVQEVRTWKKDLIRSKRELLQCTQFEKLSRAKEQREQKLLKIKLKAQAEDTKVNEIAFINELQEKNKRHEVLMKIDEHETRLQELESEKTKVMEIKTAKEESVKKRLRVIEKERQDRIDELVVKRKDKEERIEQQRLEREKERLKVASEKARERELRKEALDAAQKEAVSELQKKIKQKHNESERRHQEQLDIKKERAVELSSLGRFSSTTTTPPNMSYTMTKNENNIDSLQSKREETDFTSSLNVKNT